MVVVSWILLGVTASLFIACFHMNNKAAELRRTTQNSFYWMPYLEKGRKLTVVGMVSFAAFLGSLVWQGLM